MAQQDDGGLASPGKRWEHVEGPDGVMQAFDAEYPGMSLRDWFAGQALTSIAAYLDEKNRERYIGQCYAAADAMLAERKKEPPR